MSIEETLERAEMRENKLELLQAKLEKIDRECLQYEELIKDLKKEIWKLEVRQIVCEELERTAYESACRSAGIVKAFHGNQANLELSEGKSS